MNVIDVLLVQSWEISCLLRNKHIQTFFNTKEQNYDIIFINYYSQDMMQSFQWNLLSGNIIIIQQFNN